MMICTFLSHLDSNKKERKGSYIFEDLCMKDCKKGVKDCGIAAKFSVDNAIVSKSNDNEAGNITIDKGEEGNLSDNDLDKSYGWAKCEAGGKLS